MDFIVIMRILWPTCHHLPAQADHALEHPLDPLGQVLVLSGLSLKLLLQVVELLAQLLQTLLVSDLLDLLVSQGSLLLNCEQGENVYFVPHLTIHGKDQQPIVLSVL